MRRRRFLMSATGALLAAPRVLRASVPLRLGALYQDDQSFSPLAQSLDGQWVEIAGFMAPLLRANAPFFVLTDAPATACPFCDPEAQWSPEFLAVYTRRMLRPLPFDTALVAEGEFRLGTFSDPANGFSSNIRLIDATYREDYSQ